MSDMLDPRTQKRPLFHNFVTLSDWMITAIIAGVTCLMLVVEANEFLLFHHYARSGNLSLDQLLGRLLIVLMIVLTAAMWISAILAHRRLKVLTRTIGVEERRRQSLTMFTILLNSYLLLLIAVTLILGH